MRAGMSQRGLVSARCFLCMVCKGRLVGGREEIG